MERRARFAWLLGIIVALGFVVRVVFVLGWRKDIVFGGDAYYYHETANLIARGRWFIEPLALLNGDVRLAAHHPPLYTLFLTIPSVLGMTGMPSHLLWSCALGTATVALVGVLGRRVAGSTVGLLAALIAAFDPNFWVPDGSLMAETLAMFTTALVLVLAYWYWRAPSLGRLLACGAACGLAALSRSELALLVPFVVIPLAGVTRSVPPRQRVAWGAGAVAAAVLVTVPWVGYNLHRFREPVFLSSQFGPTLAAANCDRIYYGPEIMNYFSFPCAIEIDERAIPPGLDASQEDRINRREALHYIREHLGRLPVVVAARVGATYGIYRRDTQIYIDGVFENRGMTVSRASMLAYQVLLVLAVVGAVVLRKRRTVPVFPLLAPPAVALLTVIMLYASTRFRASAEVSYAVLAAIAIETGWNAVRQRLRRREEVVAVPSGEGHDRALGVHSGSVGEQ